MKKKCNRCGEAFYDEESEASYPIDPRYANVCSDCFEEEENMEPVYDSYSDADSGL